MNEIFVSYRRVDSQVYAGRLSDLFGRYFGDSVVFMDVDGISPGEDFVQKIGEQLSACSVFIPVIGPNWLSVRKGLRRRLFLANDFVRLEILAALSRSIEVIPVLVGGAVMPAANALPKAIAALSRRNAMTVMDDRFRADVAALAGVIKKHLDNSSPPDDATMQSERKRVTQIMEADIRKTQRRQRRQMMLAGTVAAASAIALIGWLTQPSKKPEPHFAQEIVTADPTAFRTAHPSDSADYKILADQKDLLRPQPFSRSRGGTEPVLRLSEVLGSNGSKQVRSIEKSGKIVFHAVGSTGNANHLQNMYLVANRMVKDFSRQAATPKPSFLFLLGDLIMNFGEAKYYYDQFYSPYRNYPAPILAIPGNHDGIVALGSTTRSLDGFLSNFCAETFHKSDDAMELERTAQIQPGVYFTFEAPFVRILALYSNIHESEGILSSEGGKYPELSDAQLKFLEAAFTRIKNERFTGAVIVALHHDVLSSVLHGSGQTVLAEVDDISNKTGVWPHLVLSAHAHNYERFTRTVGSTKVQYIVAGTGGANLAKLRTPSTQGRVSSDVVVQQSDDRDLGYLRITVNRKQLKLEFQVATTDASTIADAFMLDLDTRNLVP